MSEMTNEQDKQKAQKSTAEVMAEMAAAYEEKISALKAEIEQMKVDHAKDIKELLTGAEDRKKAEQDEQDVIEEAAATIAKNLGGRIKE